MSAVKSLATFLTAVVAVTVFGSVGFLLALEYVLEVELVLANRTGYVMWALMSAVVLGYMALGSYKTYFNQKFEEDPNLVSLEEIFEN